MSHTKKLKFVPEVTGYGRYLLDKPRIDNTNFLKHHITNILVTAKLDTCEEKTALCAHKILHAG
jgi:hypothetical protein